MVLNGRKKGISDAAYKRIWDYAIGHGYSPRGMSIDTVRESSNTATIGYILRSPLKLANKSNFFNHIHQGLYDRLNEHGLKMVFLGSEDDIEIDRLPELGMRSNSVKGIAIMGEVNLEFLDGVRKLGLPVAYISARATGKCHSVLSNESESASMLVDHLHNLGHTKFAWLGGNKFMGRHRERYEGIIEALKERGLSMEQQFVARLKGADRMEGSEAAKQIVEAASNQNLPTAWICLNSLMARGAISYLFQHGYKVGQDVSIAAIDMTNVCIEENPKITSASALPEDMGSEAARILLETLNGSIKSLMDVTLPAQLRILESTGPVEAEFAGAEA
jgi:DNA-binding LacI/PurR family transcriptional regulator